jgi:hypothetical protein
MSDIVAELEALSSDKRKEVYARLWCELTIAARSIWSDDRYSESQKLEGLKWLNEIQHRVWHGYMESPGYSPASLLNRIGGHVQQAQYIREHVGCCFRRAIDGAFGT